VTRVPRQILVYVFRRRDDGAVDFLLLRRLDHRGGFWQGVTGAPEPEETDEQAAVREVFEETGFDVETAIGAIDHRYLLHRPTGDPAQWDRLYGPEVTTVPEEVYVAEAPDGAEPVLAPAEHDAFTWCELETALGLLFWEGNRRALVAAHDHVGRSGASGFR
jgi:8-oxo-dGTP pyrophosphatase MutT (NUDIX family)